MRIKRLVSALLAGLLTLSLAGCGGGGKSDENSGGTKPVQQRVTLVLDWTPNTNHTGFFVAQELGYYEEAGLSVEIVQPPEDGVATLVASGNAQFGIGTQDTMAPALTSPTNALPITVVAALVQHNTSGIISMKEKGIDSPKGLEGHIYATWENPVEQATLKAVMEASGGDFGKLEMVPSSPTDILTAIQTQVDAVWIFYGWDGIAAQVKGLETNYWNFADFDKTFDYYTPVIIANDTYLKENPEGAKKFLAATAKGFEYAIENPEAAADILLKVSPELDKEIVYASQKWLSTQYKAEVERWGYITPARWDGFYTWLSTEGLAPYEIAPGTGYTNDFLPE